MLPFVFETGMGFERYVDYALDVPMYFVYRDGNYIDVAGASFRDFMAGKLVAMPGELPTLDDWSDHLTTLFPEVRMKRFLEMRGADGGRWHRICALPAFWVGLLYDDAALDAAWDLVKPWTADERQELRNGVPEMGTRDFLPGNDCAGDRTPGRANRSDGLTQSAPHQCAVAGRDRICRSARQRGRDGQDRG